MKLFIQFAGLINATTASVQTGIASGRLQATDVVGAELNKPLLSLSTAEAIKQALTEIYNGGK